MPEDIFLKRRKYIIQADMDAPLEINHDELKNLQDTSERYLNRRKFLNIHQAHYFPHLFWFADTDYAFD